MVLEFKDDDQGDGSDKLSDEALSSEDNAAAPAPAAVAPIIKKWYVVHTYSGFENKARQSLLKNIEREGLQKYFGEILMPTEQVVETVNKKQRTTNRKFYPSYLLVEMELNDYTWHCIKETPKITGFVGNSTNPPSVAPHEIAKLKGQIEVGGQKPKPKISFTEGETVRVISGPFSNFTGTVEEVKADKGKVVVSVSVFQRATPIELEFNEIEKE